MSSPLIDIIVPVYNGEQYIPDFLAQFEAQDHSDGSVRIIFVDDGSDDNSLQLLREASVTKDIPIHLISCQHGGVSAARNAGIWESTADYIAFFDVDDICSSDYLSSLKSAAGKGEYDVLLFCRKIIFDDKGTAIDNSEDSGSLEPGVRSVLLKEILTDETRFGGIHCILLNRSFVEREQLFFAEGYPYYEDTEYLYRVIAMAEGGIKVLNKYLYGYIARHDGSAMARFTPDRIRCLSLLENLEDMFEQKVPEFAPLYKRYGVSRIYWSVLWQAALAAPSLSVFRKFAYDTGAQEQMRKVAGFPDSKVNILRRLFIMSQPMYYATVRALGSRYSKAKWEMDGETLP